MTLLEDFQQFVSDAESGTQFTKWAHDNPGDLARWHTVRDAILKGDTPTLPTMTTPHGRELIDAAREYLDATPAPAPTPTPTPKPDPGAGLIWNGDLSTGDLSQWGGWEYAGTFSPQHIPPLSDRVAVGPKLDGYSPPPGCKNLMRITVKPGDQYGGSTGWRTLARQYEPIKPVQDGYDSWFAFALLLPPGYPGAKTNLWVGGMEMHQSGPTGSAPYNLRAGSPTDGFEIVLQGGDPAKPTPSVDHLTFGKGYAPGSWQVFAQRYKSGVADGAYELLYAPEGGQLKSIVAHDPCPTMYAGMTNYPLLGVYRDQVGTDVTTLYTGGWREYTTKDEAIAWANTLLGH